MPKKKSSLGPIWAVVIAVALSAALVIGFLDRKKDKEELNTLT
jgi:hypothetical protein